jgi:hypothetical protein
MNPILEQIYPDDNVVARRRDRGFPPLTPPADQYTTYLHLEMWLCYLKRKSPNARTGVKAARSGWDAGAACD